MIRRKTESAGPDAWTTLVVDAAPEFRLQTSNAGARRLDALLLTHDHADQCHGIDDIRAFAVSQRRRIDCWMDELAASSLDRRFHYIFHGQGLYPPIATLLPTPMDGVSWTIIGPSGPIPVRAFDQDHGGVRSLGYRFADIAYSSDVVQLSEEAFAALDGLDLWIVDALRYAPHPTHAHVDKALSWIERIKPKRALLTNMHIDLDYRTLAEQLPAGVEPAYDGLRLEVPLIAGTS